MGDIPVAIAVSDKKLLVSEDKLLELLLPEQKQLMEKQTRHAMDEYTRQVNTKLLYEKEMIKEQMALETQRSKEESQRREMEWRARNPNAAHEKDDLRRQAIQDEEFKKDRETKRLVLERAQQADAELLLKDVRRSEKVLTIRSIGVALICSGVGLVFLTSYL